MNVDQVWDRTISKLENEKIIGQIDGVSWVCDQNGDKSRHICSMGLKKELEKYEKMDYLFIYI